MKTFRMCYCILMMALVFATTQKTYAWSQHVHTKIGQHTLLLLPPQQQEYYSSLASHLPAKGLGFSDMSAWVDSIRKKTVYDVYSGKVPRALQAMAHKPTARWHYENAFYRPGDKAASCRVRNRGELEPALIQLSKALTEKLTRRQEAITVALFMHLVEDAHQPLHSISKVEEDCSHDRGGNLTCIQKHARSCILNLHQVWDRGFGILQDQGFWRGLSADDKLPLPITTEISLILLEGQRLAKNVYAAQPNRALTPKYIAFGKMEVSGRLRKAVRRLHYYLGEHYSLNSSSQE